MASSVPAITAALGQEGNGQRSARRPGSSQRARARAGTPRKLPRNARIARQRQRIRVTLDGTLYLLASL